MRLVPSRHEGREHQRPAEALGIGAIAGGRHELAEPVVGDGEGIDGERLDVDEPRRALAVLRQWARVRAHAEAAAGQTHDARGPLPRSRDAAAAAGAPALAVHAAPTARLQQDGWSHKPRADASSGPRLTS